MRKIKTLIYKKQIVSMMVILSLTIIIAHILAPDNFMTSYNLTIIIRAMAFVGLVAIGQSLVLLLGELDLSVGAIAGLSAILGGKMMVSWGLYPLLACVIAVFMGTVMGLINGTVISALRLNALVVTIGMAGIYKGINLVITKGAAIVGVPRSILFLGQGTIIGLPTPFFIMMLVLILIILMTQVTTFGRYIYAIGNNREAARMLGIKVNFIRIATFMIGGTLASLAGVLMMLRLGSSQTAIGEAWLLTSVAAPVIGGVALTGGVGNPSGAIIGVALIGIIENLIVLLGVSPYWQTVVSGAVVVAAISLDSISRITFNNLHT